ncbi:phosphotriesterase family protein [Paenirhodobacter populi]|uniref:phosphotriesterase family protein n=1 Tax=Paenirhodobacter populi TaxID=2306993 RepID=UPI000FE3FC5C|nr:phosphotriesterase [Sinirhodobacter populi]RWR07341.1 phosphotriesterase [Sinirhodobacter populi]
MSELSEAHVGSGLVMTVNGPVPAAELGVTLMHEHLTNDCSCWWNPPAEPERQYLADHPITPDILSELLQDPFVNKRNLGVTGAPEIVIEDLGYFTRQGGRTIVEPTCRGIGRDPVALRRIAREAGVQIVMGAGYYLGTSLPSYFSDLSVGDIADQIVTEATQGTDGTDARIGLIGEIGVGSDFTPEEERSLRGAAQAQARTGLPLMVHLPAWFRLAHRVLDICAAEGADLNHTVLCHMNPSWMDRAYQHELAARGAFIEYDMIGNLFYYADQDVDCPPDADCARAIQGLIEAGYGRQVLLSHDVFLKCMLRHYGGNGYGFVQGHFLPRLKRLGLDPAYVDSMMTVNPRRVFDAAFAAANK